MPPLWMAASREALSRGAALRGGGYLIVPSPKPLRVVPGLLSPRRGRSWGVGVRGAVPEARNRGCSSAALPAPEEVGSWGVCFPEPGCRRPAGAAQGVCTVCGARAGSPRDRELLCWGVSRVAFPGGGGGAFASRCYSGRAAGSASVSGQGDRHGGPAVPVSWFRLAGWRSGGGGWTLLSGGQR